MKIIFLDIDGVMNSEPSMVAAKERGHRPSGAYGWDSNAVINLKRILAETDAYIVISSTWRFPRFQPELAKAFRHWGLEDWIGITPREKTVLSRGKEINRWILDYEDNNDDSIDHYVILDDDSDMLEHQKKFFVQTNFHEGGLSAEHAEKAIAILNDMKPIEDYGDLYPIERFKSILGGTTGAGLMDYDGHGFYATETHYSNILALPSEVGAGNINESFTHVMWFNK